MKNVLINRKFKVLNTFGVREGDFVEVETETEVLQGLMCKVSISEFDINYTSKKGESVLRSFDFDEIQEIISIVVLKEDHFSKEL